MRIEGATYRATDRREAMKRFELLSIIGSMSSTMDNAGDDVFVCGVRLAHEEAPYYADRSNHRRIRA